MSLSGRDKIVKAGGAAPSELELTVANEIFNLEVSFPVTIIIVCNAPRLDRR